MLLAAGTLLAAGALLGAGALFSIGAEFAAGALVDVAELFAGAEFTAGAFVEVAGAEFAAGALVEVVDPFALDAASALSFASKFSIPGLIPRDWLNSLAPEFPVNAEFVNADAPSSSPELFATATFLNSFCCEELLPVDILTYSSAI